MKRLCVFLCLFLLAPAAAEASGFTAHASAGAGYIVSGGAGSNRTPTTLELAPGYDWTYVRLELPFVFGVQRAGSFPAAPNAFMGVRPQIKIFPVRWFYGKVATPLYFGDAESRSRVYFGTSFGAGFEARFFSTVAINAEANVMPFLAPEVAVPIELRAGLTILF